MADLLDIPTGLLDAFADRLEAGEAHTAAFVAAAVDTRWGRYDGLLHLADQIRSGREEVWMWFEGALPPAAVAAIREGAEAGDIVGGLRRASQAAQTARLAAETSAEVLDAAAQSCIRAARELNGELDGATLEESLAAKLNLGRCSSLAVTIAANPNTPATAVASLVVPVAAAYDKNPSPNPTLRAAYDAVSAHWDPDTLAAITSIVRADACADWVDTPHIAAGVTAEHSVLRGQQQAVLSRVAVSRAGGASNAPPSQPR